MPETMAFPETEAQVETITDREAETRAGESAHLMVSQLDDLNHRFAKENERKGNLVEATRLLPAFHRLFVRLLARKYAIIPEE